MNDWCIVIIPTTGGFKGLTNIYCTICIKMINVPCFLITQWGIRVKLGFGWRGVKATSSIFYANCFIIFCVYFLIILLIHHHVLDNMKYCLFNKCVSHVQCEANTFYLYFYYGYPSQVFWPWLSSVSSDVGFLSIVSQIWYLFTSSSIRYAVLIVVQ